MTVPAGRRPLGTIEEVSAYLRLPIRTLYSQRHRGHAPGSLGLRVGKRLVWDWEEVDSWLESKRASS